MNDIDLIIKKLNNQLDHKEQVEFTNWLNASSKNIMFFEELIKLRSKSGSIDSLVQINVDEVWNRVSNSNESREKTIVRRLMNFIKYAAIFIVAIIVPALIYFNFQPTSFHQQLVVNKKDITLKHADGSIEVIKSGEVKNILNKKGEVIGKQQGKLIQYRPFKKNKELVYNEINVPFGRQATIELSDGSVVKLNSGSKFRYPINFVDGKERRVYLDGEAYLDVFKDIQHAFIVETKEMNVEVLGTSFNVSAYGNESEVSTVLIEGSVKVMVKNTSKEVTIEPGFMAVQTSSGDLVVKEVDVDKYTAWMQNALVFVDLSFLDVTKKLERKYGVEIINNYDRLNNERYTGRFDTESILDIIESFRFDILFDYEIDGNKIIINKPTRNN